MKEQQLYRSLQAKYSKYGVLFRNNTGTAYQGRKATIDSRQVLTDIRPIQFGLCVGSSDLIGWTEIEITAAMVGQKVAIFTAVEVKKDKGRISKEQTNFIKQVRKSGGIASVMRWVDGEFKEDEV
jgi:hypothetical protein